MKINKDIEAASNQALLKEVYGNRKRGKGAVSDNAATEEDSVRLPLGKAVQNTFESLKSDPAREARISEIKQLLQKGGAAEYFKHVSTDDVAASVAEEVTLEILSSKGKISEDDEE